MKKGYVQVYTGNGKGKTTAALGLALRAAGYGMKTYVGQFMKGQHYGELDSIKMLGGLVVIEQYGLPEFCTPSNPPNPKQCEAAQIGLKKVREVISSKKYDVVVMDEITTAIHFKLISLQGVVEIVKSKPESVELVITGRYAPDELVEIADLVTEMKEIKHYYKKGIVARDGIER